MDELESIQRIRDRVFAQEQGIDPALDWDGKDNQAVHLLAFQDQQAIAVARLREVEPSPTVKLERLAVLPEYRCRGIGSELVCTAIAYSEQQSYLQMVLNAQLQAIAFYQRLGFETVGDRFKEADISHIKMKRKLLVLDGSGNDKGKSNGLEI